MLFSNEYNIVVFFILKFSNTRYTPRGNFREFRSIANGKPLDQITNWTSQVSRGAYPKCSCTQMTNIIWFLVVLNNRLRMCDIRIDKCSQFSQGKETIISYSSSIDVLNENHISTFNFFYLYSTVHYVIIKYYYGFIFYNLR